MKRLLLLAGIVAGTVAPYLPAQAHPHDHQCAGMTDSNCTRPSDGRLCDTWVEVPEVGSLCYHDPVGPDYIGGCSFGTNNDPTGQILNDDTQTGVISGTVIGIDYTGTNPASTSVECWVEVNGSRANSCSTGPVSNTPTAPIATTSDTCTYDAAPGAVVRLCQTVIVNTVPVSGPGECFDSDSVEFPPPEFWDAVCLITSTLAMGGNIGDPPNNGIEAPDGDVWVNGVKEIDCP